MKILTSCWMRSEAAAEWELCIFLKVKSKTRSWEPTLVLSQSHLGLEWQRSHLAVDCRGMPHQHMQNAATVNKNSNKVTIFINFYPFPNISLLPQSNSCYLLKRELSLYHFYHLALVRTFLDLARIRGKRQRNKQSTRDKKETSSTLSWQTRLRHSCPHHVQEDTDTCTTHSLAFSLPTRKTCWGDKSKSLLVALNRLSYLVTVWAKSILSLFPVYNNSSTLIFIPFNYL